MGNPTGKGGWVRGQSGNPAGKPKGATLSGILRRTIKRRRADGRRDLDDIAETLIEMAKGEDLDAIKLIFERTEGKVAEQLQHTGPNGGPMELAIVERITKAGD